MDTVSSKIIRKLPARPRRRPKVAEPRRMDFSGASVGAARLIICTWARHARHSGDRRGLCLAATNLLQYAHRSSLHLTYLACRYTILQHPLARGRGGDSAGLAPGKVVGERHADRSGASLRAGGSCSAHWRRILDGVMIAVECVKLLPALRLMRASCGEQSTWAPRKDKDFQPGIVARPSVVGSDGDRQPGGRSFTERASAVVYRNSLPQAERSASIYPESTELGWGKHGISGE